MLKDKIEKLNVIDNPETEYMYNKLAFRSSRMRPFLNSNHLAFKAPVSSSVMEISNIFFDMLSVWSIASFIIYFIVSLFSMNIFYLFIGIFIAGSVGRISKLKYQDIYVAISLIFSCLILTIF